jgi:ABC-type nitrate/sulfonate/bicarbonate transport system permease component
MGAPKWPPIPPQRGSRAQPARRPRVTGAQPAGSAHASVRDAPRQTGLAVLVVVLGLWQAATSFGHPDFILSPSEIARHFVEALGSGELLPHVGASLARSMPGFVVGSLIGVVLGLLAGTARGLDQLLSPVVFLTYPVPKIVFLPIVMLWVGIGDVSKIAVIALACFYPCFINAYYGARGTSTIMVWSGLNMGARPTQTFRKIVIPSALPLVFAGLRVSLALSFILLFSTEMINARSGLGFLIRQSESSLRFDLMYVAIVAVAALGYAGDQLLLLARRRVLAWQEVASR